MNTAPATINPACQIAAELGMRKGYEIMHIYPYGQFCYGGIDITSDVSVIVTAPDKMHVRIWSLTGSIAADYPHRNNLDDVIMDIESAFTKEF